MARMFGFIGNRVDDHSRMLMLHGEHLRVERGEEPAVGWGLGFYQYGEVLLRRRPIDQRKVIDLTEIAEDISTDVLIAHVRRPTVSALRTENTHPFRYRNWLFAQTGTVLGFQKLQPRLREALPEFLRRNVRGETDSELSFHLFLSFLHDAGHLNVEHPAPREIASALRSSIALVDRLSAEEGFGPNDGDLLLTDGEHLVAVHRSGLMAYRTLTGTQLIGEFQMAHPEEELTLPSPETARFTLIAGGFDVVPVGWTAVDNKSVITVPRAGTPSTESL